MGICNSSQSKKAIKAGFSAALLGQPTKYLLDLMHAQNGAVRQLKSELMNDHATAASDENVLKLDLSAWDGMLNAHARSQWHEMRQTKHSSRSYA